MAPNQFWTRSSAWFVWMWFGSQESAKNAADSVAKNVLTSGTASNKASTNAQSVGWVPFSGTRIQWLSVCCRLSSSNTLRKTATNTTCMTTHWSIWKYANNQSSCVGKDVRAQRFSKAGKDIGNTWCRSATRQGSFTAGVVVLSKNQQKLATNVRTLLF